MEGSKSLTKKTRTFAFFGSNKFMDFGWCRKEESWERLREEGFGVRWFAIELCCRLRLQPSSSPLATRLEHRRLLNYTRCTKAEICAVEQKTQSNTCVGWDFYIRTLFRTQWPQVWHINRTNSLLKIVQIRFSKSYEFAFSGAARKKRIWQLPFVGITPIYAYIFRIPVVHFDRCLAKQRAPV